MQMKLAVGYQLAEEGEEPLVGVVRDYLPHVAEVYFAWPGMASGRAAVGVARGGVDWTAQRRLEDDLRALRGMGVGLDLLLNANCYGGRAVSAHLENEVGSLLEHLEQVAGGADVVTTASPFVARAVKAHFPRVRTRASVNMRVGTPAAMEYVADLFDDYCVQRDVQRDVEYFRRLRAWADGRGKRLAMLANSGCLRCCPGQTFHDNLVAHEQEADETLRPDDWQPHTCWRWYRQAAHWPAVLQSTWVRPEDLHHYEGLADVAKLATRMHARPRAVVHAYATGRHRGNLLDLLEPGFAPAFAPHVLENARFPDDWFARTSTCLHRCEQCGYCAEVLRRVLVRADGTGDGGPPPGLAV